MSVGSVGYENEINERGERYVWPEPNVVNRLRALPRRGLQQHLFCGSRAAASRAKVKTRSRDAPVTATQCTTAMRKERPFADGAANGSIRPFPVLPDPSGTVGERRAAAISMASTDHWQ